MARVKRTGEYKWIAPKFLTPKQARRPRKGAPKGLVWSRANIGAYGQSKKYPQVYTRRL